MAAGQAAAAAAATGSAKPSTTSTLRVQQLPAAGCTKLQACQPAEGGRAEAVGWPSLASELAGEFGLGSDSRDWIEVRMADTS